MPSLPAYLTLSFLLTLPIPPIPSPARGHLTPSALGFPVALSLIPRSAFTTQTPRSWEIARCVQYLVWAWGVVVFFRGLRRTYQRMRKGTLKLDEVSSPTGTGTDETKKNGTTTTTTVKVRTSYTPSPIWTTIILHLISWRLATTLILPDLPGSWKWPFDVTTLIGLSVGLASSWAEVWRILRILGFIGTLFVFSKAELISDESTGGMSRGKIVKGTHVIMALCRLWLAVGVLSATMDTSKSGGIAPLPGTIHAQGK
jgi:hypothetical protein